MLRRRLSRESTDRYGVTIRAEAMVDGQHTLHVILEASDAEQVRKFMAPFAQGGSVSVLSASPCEDIIARGEC